MILPEKLEQILKFINTSTVDTRTVKLNDIFEAFNAEMDRNSIIAALEELRRNEYVTLHTSDNYEIGFVAPTPKGRFYFDTKDLSNNQQPRIQNININNSKDFNVGDNNVLNSNNGISFDDVRALIAETQCEYQDELRYIVDTFQDCVENSKPLPPGKFEKLRIGMEKGLPIFISLGQLLLQAFQK